MAIFTDTLSTAKNSIYAYTEITLFIVTQQMKNVLLDYNSNTWFNNE